MKYIHKLSCTDIILLPSTIYDELQKHRKGDLFIQFAFSENTSISLRDIPLFKTLKEQFRNGKRFEKGE